METTRVNFTELVKNSVLYKEFSAEREEILSHKWIESVLNPYPGEPLMPR